MVFLALNLDFELLLKPHSRTSRTSKPHVLQSAGDHNGPPQFTHANLLLPLAYWGSGGCEDLAETSVRTAYFGVHEFANTLKELDYVAWFDAVDLGKDDLEGNSFTAELAQEEDIILFEAVSGVY